MSILAFADAAEPQALLQGDIAANRPSSQKNTPYLYTFSDEKDLLKKARAGNQDAKTSLIMAERATINRLSGAYAFRLHQSLDAEEIAQRTFLKLLEMDFARLFSKQTSVRFRHFVEKVMKNMFLDVTRRHKTKLEISYDTAVNAETGAASYIENIASPTPNTESIVEQKEQIAALLARISALPGKQRETFIARLMGESTIEAARLVGVSEGSIKTHMARSLANITFAALPGFSTLSKTFMKSAPLTQDEIQHRDCIEEVRRTAIRELHDAKEACIFSCTHLVPKNERIALEDLAEAMDLTLVQTRQHLSNARQTVLRTMDPKHRSHPFAEKIAADDHEMMLMNEGKRAYLIDALHKALIVLEYRNHIMTDAEITRHNFPEWTAIQKRLASDYDGLKIEDVVLTWIKDEMMAFHNDRGHFPKNENIGIPDYPAITWAQADNALCDYYDSLETKERACAAPQPHLELS